MQTEIFTIHLGFDQCYVLRGEAVIMTTVIKFRLDDRLPESEGSNEEQKEE